jgi:MFS family permease
VIDRRGRAMTFVALVGVVSLFADMTYEAGRSINGPYLALLGAGSLAVGMIAGSGELLGCLVRPLSGAWADRTGRYWPITLAGYAVNLFAVPALALAGSWPVAAVLMVAERIGKGIRNPPRDAMLSAAGSVIGQGWAFGFHEAMDQVGATIGPLIVALVLFQKGGYHHAYALLLVPAALAVGVVVAGRLVYPHPEHFEEPAPSESCDRPDEDAGAGRRFPPLYWFYLAGIMLVAMGFADFPLIAFHFHEAHTVSADLVPVLYAVAMAVDAAAAMAFGAMLERIGPVTMLIGVAVALFFAPFVFAFSASGETAPAFIGMALWGIGMGAHESVMSAIIAKIIPFRARGRAIGLFNAAYGGAWFVGSAIMGFLYGVSIPALIAFSMTTQAVSLPFLAMVSRRLGSTAGRNKSSC